MSEATEKEPTFWEASWTWIKRVFRWVAAPLPALLLVAGAVLLVVFGVKNIQIGGLLNKLFGKEDKKATGNKAIDVANSVPKDRVDENGKLIPPGTSDSKGQTQAVVVPIKTPGLFDDPDVVKIVPPGETDPVEVVLPDGVKAKDVDKVVIVKPDVTVITVKDSSGVKAKDVDDLLSKYGS
jgi:hypothetical protein